LKKRIAVVTTDETTLKSALVDLFDLETPMKIRDDIVCEFKPKRYLARLVVFGILVQSQCLVVIDASAQENKSLDSAKHVTKTVSGRVVDSKGAPIENAFVCFYNAGSSAQNSTTTTEQGEFSLEYLEKKTALDCGFLWAYSPDHNLRCVTNLRKTDHLLKLPDYTEFKIKFLTPGGNPLSNAKTQPYRFTIPNGTYANDDGKGGLGGILPKTIQEKLVSSTDENGVCTVTNIPRALWGRMIIESGNYGKQIIGGTKNDTFQLAETGSLSVQILPDEPIDYSGKAVHLSSWGLQENSLVGEIDGQGFCHFKHVVPGKIAVSISIEESHVYQPKIEKQYDVTANKKLEVRIPIKKTVEVLGKVVAGKDPVPFAKVFVGARNKMVIADESGEFKTRVFPGSVKVNVYDVPHEFYRKYEPGDEQKITVEDGDRPFKLDTIELVALPEFVIQVVDEIGDPVGGFGLRSLYPGKQHGPIYGQLNEKGIFTAYISKRHRINNATYYLASPNQKKETDFTKLVKLRIASTEPLVLSVDSAELNKKAGSKRLERKK
jgi:outer membrane lipoprotein-sorting protein